MAPDDPDFLPVFMLASVACIVLHFLRRALVNWFIRTLTEAGEGNAPLIQIFKLLSSPLLLIPVGIYFMAMSALTYGGSVELGLPWWLSAWLGFEALTDGLDNLLRKVPW